MRASWNRPAIIGFVLGLTGVVAYFTLVVLHNPSLSWLVRAPVANVALIAAGLSLSALGVARAFRRGGRGRVLAPILGVSNVALSVFLISHLFFDSYNLPPAARAPAIGAPAPDFELLDDRGAPLRLSALRGRNVALVFYRGFW